MYYFAGATWSEKKYRDGMTGSADEFIFSHDETFRNSIEKSYWILQNLGKSGEVSPKQIREFRKRMAEEIDPINLAGLCNPAKNNMYPYLTESGG